VAKAAWAYTTGLDIETGQPSMAQRTQKPHKGLSKRVKVSAGGKVRYKKPFAGHLMSSKSGRRRQRLRRPGGLTGQIADNVRRALGVG
jgi:large subunit ribosomal protein L35